MRWVLLPGFDGTGLLFEPFLRTLRPEDDPTVVRYPSDRCCSADELVEIVLSSVPSEPYLLIAESFSGPIALRAASLHPPEALVLCASFATCPYPRTVAVLTTLGTALFRYPPPRPLVRRYLMSGASDEVLSLFYRALRAVSPDVLANRLTVLLEFGGGWLPPGAPAPMLYLQARRDHLISPRQMRFVQRQYPALRIQTIDSPHFMLQAEPQAALQAILAFLAQSPPRQAPS